MPNPGLARATKAVSAEKPSGTSSSPKDRTVLQQHVDFFDFDKDGETASSTCMHVPKFSQRHLTSCPLNIVVM